MFIGREREIKLLKDITDNPKAKVAIIYGRRRIGKSSLIQKTLENKQALYFEGIENQSKKNQINNFITQFKRQTGINKWHEPINTWSEAFLLLENVLKNNPACIVLDEFQWMANYRVDIVSELKMVWDLYLSKIQGVSLILCGSIASFMKGKVIKSSAFYGRCDQVIHLQEFDLKQTCIFLKDKGSHEIIDAQMYLGGIPKYLELIKEEPSVQIGIDKLSFSPNGYFYDEFDRIFVSHFGKTSDYYKIVTLLSKYPYGLVRKQIIEKTKTATGGQITLILENLQSAGMIASNYPVDKKDGSKLKKYYLIDPYLRFYFAFIKDNKKKISEGFLEGYFSKVKQSNKFNTFKGRAFEYLCIAHAKQIADILGFGAIEYNFGPYYRSSEDFENGVQIDMLYDRADNILTLIEAKYTSGIISTNIIPQIEKKINHIKKKFPKKTVQPVLIVEGEVSDKLKNALYFYKIIKASSLLN
ncbi:MAG: ATP-binding protein [Deltaproteobacteria bacterium]|nr:ATP-binding protein [Deltaproteobacteria bacterium]